MQNTMAFHMDTETGLDPEWFPIYQILHSVHETCVRLTQHLANTGGYAQGALYAHHMMCTLQVALNFHLWIWIAGIRIAVCSTLPLHVDVHASKNPFIFFF